MRVLRYSRLQENDGCEGLVLRQATTPASGNGATSTLGGSRPRRGAVVARFRQRHPGLGSHVSNVERGGRLHTRVCGGRGGYVDPRGARGEGLDRLVEDGRKPEVIVLDNGPELTSKALDQWAVRNLNPPGFPGDSFVSMKTESRPVWQTKNGPPRRGGAKNGRGGGSSRSTSRTTTSSTERGFRSTVSPSRA